MGDFISFLEKFLSKNVIPVLRDKPWNVRFTVLDTLYIFLLAIVTLVIRFHRFWHPPNVVFDEIHFGNFTNYYIKHEYFFDIHPPLAKLLLAGYAVLSGYNGSIPFGDIFGKPYPDEQFIPLRILPIIFSSLVPPLLYLAVRLSGFSRIAGTVSAAFIVFDTTMLAEGKFILTDGFLHFFVALAICIFMYWFSLPRHTPQWKVWMYVSSIAMGCAFSVKYTALSLCFVVGFHEIVMIFIDNQCKLDEAWYHNLCIRIFQLAVPALCLHVAFWLIHLSLLWYAGSDYGDSSKGLENTLINLTTDNPNNMSKLLSPPILLRVATVLLDIQSSNMLNFKSHGAMSRPIDWPFLTDVAPGFWNEDNQHVICLGNIFVYGMGFTGVLMCLLAFRRRGYFRVLTFVVGYLMSYLPFFLVPRTMFLYHYTIPLMFASMCFGISLDIWVGAGFKGFVCPVLIALVAYGFSEFSPLVYAKKIPSEEYNSRLWNRAWVYGRSGRRAWIQKYDAAYERAKAQRDMFENRKRK